MEIKKVYFFIFLLLLTGCSEFKHQQYKELFNLISNKQEEKRTVTRKDLESIGYPIIKVKTNGIIKETYLLPITQRDNYINYISGKGQSLTAKNLNLIRTHGFKINLISLNRTKDLTLDNLNKYNSFKYNKIYEYVLPSFASKKIMLNCTSSLVGKDTINIMLKEHILFKISEICQNNTIKLNNYYWVDENNYFWKINENLPEKEINIVIESIIQ